MGDLARFGFERIEQLLDAVIWTATMPELRITHLSPGAEDLLGCPAGDLLGSTALWERLHPDERDATLDVLRGVAPAGERRLAHRIIRHDGTTRWALTSVRALESGDPGVTTILGLTVDITERARAMEVLRDGERWLQLIVDQLPVIIWTTDLDLKFTSGAGAGLAALGIDPGQLSGLSLFHYFQTDDPEHPIIRKIREVIETQQPTSYESEWLGKTYRTLAQPFRNASGELLGTIGISVDITEQRQFEERLLVQADRARRIAELAARATAGVEDPDPIVDLTARTLVELLGDFAVLLLVSEDGRWLHPKAIEGRVPEQVDFGRQIRELRKVRSDEGIEAAVFAGGGTRFFPEADASQLLKEAAPAGAEFIERFQPHSVVVTPFRARGRMLGVVIVARTITAQPYTEADKQLIEEISHIAALALDNAHLLQEARRTETQLRQAQKMEALGRLAGGIAHDFNNLMVVILSYADLLLGQLGEDDPQYADVGQIRLAGERATSLTNQLLTFSRRRVAQTKVIRIDRLISSLAAMLRRVIREDVQLTIESDRDLWPIKADPDQISQMILNLAMNARDAMVRGGRLTIETRNVEVDGSRAQRNDASPGPHVMLLVSDTGVGMTAETKAHLFEPFFTTKEPGKGTGLGLATIFGVVRQLGGFIEVETEVQHGSTFRIFLPRSAGAVEDLPAARAQPQGGEESGTILLVEDDPAVRSLVTRILRQSGYQVVAAALPSEALRLCEGQTVDPDLVLTDVVMPEMSGVQLVERLARLVPRAAVLYMSGYSGNVFELMGPDATYLPKPFTKDALLARVKWALANQSR